MNNFIDEDGADAFCSRESTELIIAVARDSTRFRLIIRGDAMEAWMDIGLSESEPNAYGDVLKRVGFVSERSGEGGSLSGSATSRNC